MFLCQRVPLQADMHVQSACVLHIISAAAAACSYAFIYIPVVFGVRLNSFRSEGNPSSPYKGKQHSGAEVN